MDFVHVHVEVLCACPHLLADLGADILGPPLTFGGVASDAIHDGDHEVLDLALLVGLRALEPVRHGEEQPLAAIAPEGYGLGAAVQRPDPPPSP